MKVPAQRIGQRVNRTDRRIGKRLPGQAGSQQHRLARFTVFPISHYRRKIRRKQTQGFTRQQVRQRILLDLAGVGLDGMHHGIDASGCSNRRRQAQGQIGVEHSQIRQQHGRNHTHLGGFAGGDNCHRSHLGTGASRGRHLDQRQALAPGIADAVDVLERLQTRRMRQQSHQLGHVHRTTATETDH